VTTNKDRHILSAVQILGRDSSFWRYKVCEDIRVLHKGDVKGQWGRAFTLVFKTFSWLSKNISYIYTERPIL